MGADFITAFLVVDQRTTLDFSSGRAAIERIVSADVDDPDAFDGADPGTEEAWMQFVRCSVAPLSTWSGDSNTAARSTGSKSEVPGSSSPVASATAMRPLSYSRRFSESGRLTGYSLQSALRVSLSGEPS